MLSEEQRKELLETPFCVWKDGKRFWNGQTFEERVLLFLVDILAHLVEAKKTDDE